MAWVKLDDGFFRNPKIIEISPESKLIYLAGLCYSGAALTDGFIPKNAVRMLASDAGVSASKRRIEELVGAGLWVENPRGYSINDYLEYNQSAENVRANKEAAKNRMARKRSGEVRANNERTSEDVREPDTDTDIEERDKSLSHEEPKNDGVVLRDVSKGPNRADILEERFNRFWEHYPRKEAKGAARKAWMRIKPSDALTDRMIAAVNRQKSTAKWKEEQGRFIPHPATWLNAERWEDQGVDETQQVRRHIV